MRTLLRHMDGEGGGATVEFALCSLILVPTILYSVFFYELAYAKLKTNEISRYLVWEMTAYGLSDFQEGKHSDKFGQAREAILNEVKTRYADDLDGATPDLVPNYKAKEYIAIEVSVDPAQVTLNDAPAGVFNLGDFEGISDVAGQLFSHFGFNENGRPTGEFKLHIKNKLLGKMMPIGYKQNMLEADEFDLGCKQALIADSWDLKSGAQVAEIGYENCNSDYCKQVERMAFLGLADEVSGPLNGLSDLVTSLGMHFPLAVSVVSIPMSGTADGSHQLEIARPPCHTHGAIKKHYTNVYKDTYTEGNSRYVKLYRKLGPCYMGCPKALQQEGQCPYDNRNTQTVCKL